jgi:hypothetical protein
MPDDSSSSRNSPAPPPKSAAGRLDRSALERVLARAAELQSGTGDSDEAFSEEQLLELGREVGISAQNLRQALAEERTRSIVPEDEAGFSAGLFGPSRVRAARVVPGRSTDALAAIDTWMQRQELLIVKRHHPDRIVWEPRRDFLVGVKRALKVGGRDYALSQSFEVSATVLAIDDTQVHVALDADFRSQSSRSTKQVVASSVVGGVATVSLVAMGVATAIAAAPIFILSATGILGARALQGRVVTRAQLAMEQLLDRLERGEYARRGPETLLGAIVAAATSLPPKRF